MRVARFKRERMHAHLLRSVMSVCSGDRSSDPKVIDDVVKHAEVSRGTFYKHFSSLEEAVAELGGVLAGEMTDGILPLYEPLRDPRERTAMGFQLFLRRAALDPQWGGFIAHVGLLKADNAMIRHMADDIERGLAVGLYDLPSVVCGLDLLVGTKIEAIRQVVRGERGSAHGADMATLVLKGFGRPALESERIVAEMGGRIDADAPRLLEWWPRSA